MKAPVDLSFSDLEHGWLLGLACDNDKIRNNCVPALRKSTDGGATWERATMPPAGVARVKQAGTDAQVDYIRFMTPKDGWMFGPGLFSTHDGGKTWQDEHPSGEIAALEVNDKSVWAVERSCAKPYEECIFTLRTSTDKGRTWEWTVVPVKDPWYTAQLVRLNANTAWLYTWGDEMSLSKSSLLATHDGGKTWQPRIHPCLPEAAKLVSEPPGKLWLFCGSEPGAGSQGKRLYGSSNDGRTWKIVASTLESETQGLNNLPIGGDFSDFVRTAPGKLWALYYGSSGHLERSTDAGRTWSAVKIGDYLEAATGPIVFKDALHGWLPVYHRVWRTTDGGDNWTPFDIDPGFQEDTGP